MTESEQERLQYALNELNQRIEELLTKYGEGISIRPRANYSDLDGFARIEVEVTTGRVVLKSAYLDDSGNGVANRSESGTPKRRGAKHPTTRTSKYAPLIAAWEFTPPSKGFSVEELHALAKKTVDDVPNANSLRTFLFTMKNEGKVRKSDDGKWHLLRN